MRGELAILVPSRGRPENLQRLMETVHATSMGRTHVIAGIDYDDPRFRDYQNIKSFEKGDRFVYKDRMNLVQWTNYLAEVHAGEYNFYASLGDDMVPRTKGWDVKLMECIDGDFNGTGISYPWDGVRDDIPEAYVISADIPEALGWVMQPTLQHFYNDNVIADLGHGASCIRQLRGVVVEHLNVGMGKAIVDQTALDNGLKIQGDKKAYEEWRRHGILRDVQTVKNLRS